MKMQTKIMTHAVDLAGAILILLALIAYLAH